MNKFMITAAVAASFIALFAVTAFSEDTTTRFQLTLRGWFSATNVSNDLVKELFSKPGDAVKKLDIGDEVAPEARLRWQFAARQGLELRYLYLLNTSDSTIRHPLLFKDDPTLFFSRLKSDVDLNLVRLGWHWAIIQPESGFFRLETIVDVTGGKASGEYKHYRLAWPFFPDAKHHADAEGILPTVGLAATLSPFDWFDVFGEISGMTAGEYGSIFDYEAGLRLNPFKWLGIEGGYRHLKVSGSDSDHDPQFSFEGPFCGAKLRF